MTLPVARDLSAVGIRVNTVAPGLIDTPIYGEGEASEQFKERLGAGCPAKGGAPFQQQYPLPGLRQPQQRPDAPAPTDESTAAPVAAYGVEPDVTLRPGAELMSEVESSAGLGMPVGYYAIMDSALRHAQGLSPDAHRDQIARMYARFSEIAAANPDHSAEYRGRNWEED